MKKKYFIDVGKRLKEVRSVLGIQQNEMARAVGFNPAYLSELEKGNKTNPGFAFLFNISSHYRVSLDYLVHGIGDMFLPGAGSEEQRIDTFQPVFNTVDDLVFLLKRSNYAKNTILGYAVKFFLENEDILKMEMMRGKDKGREESKAPAEEESPGKKVGIDDAIK